MSFIAGLFIGSLLAFIGFCVLTSGGRSNYESRLIDVRDAIVSTISYYEDKTIVFPLVKLKKALELIDEE